MLPVRWKLSAYGKESPLQRGQSDFEARERRSFGYFVTATCCELSSLLLGFRSRMYVSI